jgi:beta-galactosidase
MQMKRDKITIICLVCVALLAAFDGKTSSAQTRAAIDLSGEWRFALDKTGSASWPTQLLPDKIKLPGVLQSQGYGDEISTRTPWVLSLYDRNWFDRADYKAYTKPGSVKVPFLSQPPRHYIGAAWYQRDVSIPDGWRGKRVVLTLERPKWQTTVWIDDKKIGSRRSLVAPHEFDLGIAEPGNHRLTILVDNSMILPYRPDAHGVSDSLGMSWNGITGAIKLEATSPVWIDDAQAFPKTTTGGILTHREGVSAAGANLRSGYALRCAEQLCCSDEPPNILAAPPPDSRPSRSASFRGSAEKHSFSAHRMAQPGSKLACADEANRGVSAAAIVRVRIGNSTNRTGSGTLTANGKSFPVAWTPDGGNAELEITFPNAQTWNEFHPELQKLHLELKGEGADDARDVTFGFRDIRAVGKEFQLNGRRIYLRGTHHGGDFPLTGYPPSDVAYWKKIFQINKDWGINHVRFHSFCPPDAAFQAADELGIYLQPEPGMWNEVSPGTAMEAMLYEETELMIRAYGNHPSFLLFSPSNEPKGRWKEAFDKWIAHYRLADPRRLYTNGTGHTEREVPNLAVGTDYLAMQRIGPKMLRGNTAWFGQDYGMSLDRINVPVVSHELGQWVAYPDYDVIKKFTGYMRPGNYEIFRDSLAGKGLLSRGKDFAYASGKFQLACYKEEIEANLRTPGMDGFQLLDLHDYLGQGTALVGLLDALWEEKGYVTAKEFRRFNGTTVPLARIEKRVLLDSELLAAQFEIAHFGEFPIKAATPYWKIVDNRNNVFAGGDLPALDIPVGKNIKLGKIKIPLERVSTATALRLIVGIKRTAIENDWNVWVYPDRESPSPGQDIVIAHSWDEAEKKLAEGRKVFYMPPKAHLDWTSPPLDWVPVFWNRLMNPAWGRMLGLWIDSKHPALAEFPTENYFDWQWTELVRGTRAINLDRLSKGLQPIVQPIDDWNRNYKLGLIFEARVGRGKLLVSSIDLENRIEWRLSARQLRRSILNYMASSKFDPKVSMTAANFRDVLFDTRIMKRLGATAASAGDAANAIDGDPNTFWIAGDPRAVSRQNQELTINFPNAVSFSGLVVMPRQNHREHEGDIREYSIQISVDGTNWTEVKRGELLSTFDQQSIVFASPVSAKAIKITSLSGFGADKTTALAEVAVIYTGPKLPDNEEELEYKRSKAASPDIDEGVTPEEKKSKKP